MRLLIDQNPPRTLATGLQVAGHDVVHTEDVGLAKAPDPQILDLVLRPRPNADHLRTMRTDHLTRLLVANLPQLAQALDQHGPAVFVLAPSRPVRAELLPLGPARKD